MSWYLTILLIIIFAGFMWCLFYIAGVTDDTMEKIEILGKDDDK